MLPVSVNVRPPPFERFSPSTPLPSLIEPAKVEELCLTVRVVVLALLLVIVPVPLV